MYSGQMLSRPSVDCGELLTSGLATPAGADGVVAASGDSVMTGRMREMHLRPGLSLYASDVCDQQDMDVSTGLPAGLLLVLPLAGEADVSYGERHFKLGSRCDSEDGLQPEGLAITLTEPEAFTRRLRRGARRRVVSLALGQCWLDDSEEALTTTHPSLSSFRRTHLAAQRWRLSPRLQTLAGDLLEMGAPSAPLMSLYLESRCLEVVAEVLSAIASDPPPATGLRPREQRRLAQLREFLDSGEGDGQSLQQLADRIGMSPSTLQRYFRAYCGMSVFAYQRRRLLLLARNAIERDGISVGEAAHLAGYTSPANFATAFRRQFGTAPGRLRARH
jgi:AraC-like DNA-binding protein